MDKKVAFYTLGCKSNQYDTEIMKRDIRKTNGYNLVPFGDDSDIAVINTCSVTTGADRKSRKYIRRAGKQSGLVLVTGCYVTLDYETIDDIDEVDVIFPNSRKYEFIRILEMVESGHRGKISGKNKNSWNIDSKTVSSDTSHTRAFVKIQDGCSNSCSFCKVRYLRGPARSKSPLKVIKEARKLGKNGFRELVLTGINLSEYGNQGLKLAGLIEKLSQLEEISRIRLSSVNPDGITHNLVDVFSRSDKGCPYFHIPLQSGSDSILNSMNRGYTREYYLDKIDLIRDRIPGSTFGTDLMVGFPGETEKDYQLTKDMVRRVGFTNVHVFRYSDRDKTPASEYEDRVHSSVKNRRAKELRSLAASVSHKEREKFKDKELEMILEEPSNKLQGWRGYSRNYLDLHLPERDRTNGKGSGDVLKVKITEVNEDFCVAKYPDFILNQGNNGTQEAGNTGGQRIRSQESSSKLRGL